MHLDALHVRHGKCDMPITKLSYIHYLHTHARTHTQNVCKVKRYIISFMRNLFKNYFEQLGFLYQ